MREQLWYNTFIGDDSKVDTPLPIPNREVKHFYGENSVSEDSKLPIFLLHEKLSFLKKALFWCWLYNFKMIYLSIFQFFGGGIMSNKFYIITKKHTRKIDLMCSNM